MDLRFEAAAAGELRENTLSGKEVLKYLNLLELYF